MMQDLLRACSPWLGLLIVLVTVAAMLMRVAGGRWRGAQLATLVRDQEGGVQSLSFVLAFPVLITVGIFIVQVSQLMIGVMIVHYAAFAAARAATVWVPASIVGSDESANRISQFKLESPGSEEHPQISTYSIVSGSGKYRRIELAAILACMPICPSRQIDAGGAASGSLELEAALMSGFGAWYPASLRNGRINQRIQNKLAYSLKQTSVRIEFTHNNEADPPLQQYFIPDDHGEFYPNEMGWQDPMTVTVTHHFALLPGPGRLLARWLPREEGGTDRVSESIESHDGLYTYLLSASATLGNEGQQSVEPYVYELD